MKQIGFIGAGMMAEALIKALLESNLFDKINASDVNKERLEYLKGKYKINIFEDNKKLAKKSEIIVLSIKPQNMGEVLDEITDSIENQLIISIAAGIKIKFIQDKLESSRIVRVMPNVPCLVGEMAAGYCIGNDITDSDKELIHNILNSAGKAFLVDEKMLDAVTGLSGSGPAFFAYILEGFIEAGKKQGLDENISKELALQTMKGTTILLEKKSTKELIEMVSSPKGTTVAGREILENSEIKKIISKTIEATVKRSKELGK